LVKIAVTGKGGVGKTLIAAGLAWSLARSGKKTIAIDADPSPNLGLMLGLSQEQADAIIPLSENESLIREKTGTAFPGVYNLNFSVTDVVRDFAVHTPAGVHLLVMGTVRQMGAGCTCSANSLVRNLLRHLMMERNEAVVLDMEAGIEHLGRGTADSVDLMLVVTTADCRAISAAGTIVRMAKRAGIPLVMLAGNRIEGAPQEDLVRGWAEKNAIPVIGFIPYDRSVADAGITGSSVLSLQTSPAMAAIGRMMAAVPLAGISAKGDRSGEPEGKRS
jgi:CO dehydrogenase maturation factor